METHISTHSTGQLAASFAVIPVNPGDLKIPVFNLSHYATSEHRVRCFCPECGANVMDFEQSDGMWRICTGIMDETQGLLKRDQIWLEDTLDGGQALWLEGIGERFMVGNGSEVVQQNHAIFKAPNPVSPIMSEERLLGRCHCGEVEFGVGAPPTGERYDAGIDTCTSCRLTTGFELTAWTSVPLEKVQMTSGAPLNLSMNSLKRYSSSLGVQRYFCEHCGATIFVGKDDQSWIDIAVGLFRADEGARAERWLKWNEVGFPDEATDQNLITTLRKGLKA
ncbi:hypothetical protein LTR84_005199 [Exophiala bonariae]|uniref:CENP-V/GFA domain-containing protein n=1 Tax=Exophiala bonariae TaxID=1690606 RepID=A0AAV9NP36_9EURO|nr:hypothetical protein LTR84_005199 [Exophiala bonariae]